MTENNDHCAGETYCVTLSGSAASDFSAKINGHGVSPDVTHLGNGKYKVCVDGTLLNVGDTLVIIKGGSDVATANIIECEG